MLEITERAGAVLAATIRAAEGRGSMFRLAPATDGFDADRGRRTVRVDLVGDGPIDDEIVEAPGGTIVRVDADVALWVDDKVLDASRDAEGHTSLTILPQTD